MNNNNPFEYMQSFMKNENFTKNMKDMPNMDFSSASNMMKSTAEAINSTNQMASESVQSIVKRGADSLQKNTTELYNTMKEAVSAGDANQINQCQQKYLLTAMDNNVNSAKEILDMSTKSMMEIIDVFHSGLKENINKNQPKAKK
jgi:hypothetical protein